MSFVNTEVQGAVAVVTIDRPKALNALNPEVLSDLKAAFEGIDQNTVRCVVLDRRRGQGLRCRRGHRLPCPATDQGRGRRPSARWATMSSS